MIYSKKDIEGTRRGGWGYSAGISRARYTAQMHIVPYVELALHISPTAMYWRDLDLVHAGLCISSCLCTYKSPTMRLKYSSDPDLVSLLSPRAPRQFSRDLNRLIAEDLSTSMHKWVATIKFSCSVKEIIFESWLFRIVNGRCRCFSHGWWFVSA